jgi:hypothetical protein
MDDTDADVQRGEQASKPLVGGKRSEIRVLGLRVEMEMVLGHRVGRETL